MSSVKNVVCAFAFFVLLILIEKVFKPLPPTILIQCAKIVSRINSNTDISSPFLYVSIALVSFITYHVYNLIFRPLNRVRILGDFGYQKDGKFSPKEIANSVKKRRDVGEIPPVYPNGWFAVIESWGLRKGESKNVHVLGQELAVFRDEIGDAHVLDAYCPHMGANLAVGGLVVGDCIQCPFHGWKFRGHDGKCTGIPYAEKIPDIARVKSWTTLEVNGWINIWYHAEDSKPYWTLPDIEEITNGTLRYSGRTEHYANTHIELERDIRVWNNKKFQIKPMLTKTSEDSLIARHRRWYSQFYSEHSPRLKFQKDTLDW